MANIKYGYYTLSFRNDPHSMFIEEECYGSDDIVSGFDTMEEAEAAGREVCEKAGFHGGSWLEHYEYGYDADLEITEADRTDIKIMAAEHIRNTDILIQYKHYSMEKVLEVISEEKEKR